MLNQGSFCFYAPKSRVEAVLRERNYPFVAVGKNAEGAWLFSCTKLSPKGRCTIYKDRPYACIALAPAGDPLCVHFKGAEAGDPTIDINTDPYKKDGWDKV